MISSYNPWLVSLSLVVAVLVSFTSLSLASRVAESGTSTRRAWLTAGSISMGVGIWSTHFIGMLAFSAPFKLRYDIGTTFLSLLTAIGTSGLAIRMAARVDLTLRRYIVASLGMGFGIAGMHYIGMTAIPVFPAASYDIRLVGASIAIAVGASFVALWLTFTLRRATHKYAGLARAGAAVIMGSAIAGMHYTGMAAMTFQAGAYCRGGLALDDQWMGVSVAIATMALLALTLVIGIFDSHLHSRARLHTERLQRANSRLSHQAMHDATTALPTRANFLGKLQAAIDESRRTDIAGPLAVMLVDLDRFKMVNDSLGHQVGDAILREVARRLEIIVGSQGMVARMGGDEFLVMVRLEETKRVMLIANQIVMQLSEMYRVDAVELHLAVSVGVTTYPFDNSAPYVLISHADEAMYEAKRRGGNSFRFFVPGTTIFTMQRLELENDLRRAATLGQLELHYQPQVDIVSGRIMGLEALARWKHPTHGWISPAEFIPLAESSDLIVKIGQWVLDEACRQARLWHQQGFDDLSIAVNVSARQFRQANLVAMIEETVTKHGLLPKHIVIELTESVVMSDADKAIEVLERLHAAGFEVAVDDFGTGYSSMSYLKRLPIGKLKVDRSFVNDLGSSAKSDSIVIAVIALAHGLNMAVVAEGVETARQLALLRAFGCDQYQGYLYSRARTAADIVQLLARHPQPAEENLAEALLAEFSA
jgi:diguanylate cyclase (GGDEF)-like protein